jgi:hypothetical protein
MKELAKLMRDIGRAWGPHTEATALGHRLLHNRLAGEWVPFVPHVPSVWTRDENLAPDPAPKHYAYAWLLAAVVAVFAMWLFAHL